MNATDSDGKPQPTLIEVPDAQFGSTYTWARDMNDWGDVVGVYRRDDQTYGAYIYNPGIYGEELGYDPVDLGIGMRDYDVHINNNGQIAGILTNGNAFRYTIAIDDMEQFSPTSDSSGTYTWETVADLNESGVFCGSQKLTYTKKQKGLDYTHVAYRFDNVIERLPFERRGYAVDINSSGDFVTALYGKIYLDKLGYFDINSLLDPTDEDAAIFLGGWPIQYPRINDRIWISADDITGFPCIAGHIMGADDIIYNYILTPVAPPASQ